MTRHLAQLTITAIDSAIQKDQGASYRGWLKKVMPHLPDAYDDKIQTFEFLTVWEDIRIQYLF